MKKQIISLILMGSMAISVLSACGGTTSSSSASSSSPTNSNSVETETTSEAIETSANGEDATLSMWIYDDSDDVTKMYEDFADSVHNTYPNITIEIEVLPYDSGPEKFSVACATNTTPDLYFDGYSRIAPAVQAGLTVDVSDIIEKYSDSFITQQQDGQLNNGGYGYLATATGAAYGILVNESLAEKLGVADMLPEDKATWSYEDFLNICRTAHEADSSVIPVSLWAGTQSADAWYYSWLIANGVSLTNSDLTATAFNDGDNKEKAEETFNLFKTIIDENLAPQGCATISAEDCMDLFRSGNLLFCHGAFSNLSSYLTEQEQGTCADFDLDMYCIPTSEGKEVPTVCNWGSYGYAGFTNNNHEDAIKKVLEEWVKDPKWQTQLTELTGRFSLMSTTDVEWPEKIADRMDFGQQYSAEHAISNFGILEPWWADFRTTLYPQLQDFYTGNIDTDTLLANWQNSADKIIADAQETS